MAGYFAQFFAPRTKKAADRPLSKILLLESRRILAHHHGADNRAGGVQIPENRWSGGLLPAAPL